MPAQSIVLVSQISDENNSFAYSEKQKGDGYYNAGDGLHTVVYLLDHFSGVIKVQATLAINPTESDWFDVSETVLGDDSTAITESAYYRNFTGNFVWIRAAYQVTNGTIREIRYNH